MKQDNYEYELIFKGDDTFCSFKYEKCENFTQAYNKAQEWLKAFSKITAEQVDIVSIEKLAAIFSAELKNHFRDNH